MVRNQRPARKLGAPLLYACATWRSRQDRSAVKAMTESAVDRMTDRSILLSAFVDEGCHLCAERSNVQVLFCTVAGNRKTK